MNLKTEISQLKSELDKVEDVRVLKLIKEILEFAKTNNQQDWWNDLSEKEKAIVEEAIKQADTEKPISYSKVRKGI